MPAVGVGLIGAHGRRGATVVVGARAVARRLAGRGRGRASRPSRRGAFVPRGEPLAATVDRLGDDLDGFRRDQGLDTVIVVNVASTEPSRALSGDHQRLDRFQRVIQENRRALVTPSMVYAYAALERGFPYVTFTPSVGVAGPALRELG